MSSLPKRLYPVISSFPFRGQGSAVFADSSRMERDGQSDASIQTIMELFGRGLQKPHEIRQIQTSFV